MPTLKIENLPLEYKAKDVKELLTGWNHSEVKNDYKPGDRSETFLVDFPEEEEARSAQKQLNNKKIKKKLKLRVNIVKRSVGIKKSFDHRESKSDRHSHSQRQSRDRDSRGTPGLSNQRFPYHFVDRPLPDRKEPPGHDRLHADRFDIAFDVTWETMTPVAANPCSDPRVPSNQPLENESEYSGYDLRWLMLDGRLAISPFTVKSALANGFSNLLGSCYRVTNKTTGHKGVEQGQYPYGGAWKRYRVNQDGMSKPGILMDIVEDGGHVTLTIQPCKEYYFDESRTLPFPLKKYDQVTAAVKVNRGNKPALIESLTPHGQPLKFNSPPLHLQYFGPYAYGMDGLCPDGPKHHHRFFEKAGPKIEGCIPAEIFHGSQKDLEDKVYLGQYKHDGKKRWYQDLRDLKKDDWVYYQAFDGKVVSVGKNFLFKALFYHPDTIPSGHACCDDITALCPRCALVGMTASDSKQHDAVGYRGRLKASTLVCNLKAEEIQRTAHIPVERNGRLEQVSVPIKAWKAADGKIVSEQMLMPIQGPPKPNRRDVYGYFDRRTGNLRGAKIYRHASKQYDDLAGLKRLIDHDINRRYEDKRGKLIYTHRMRNWAQACDKGLEFCGTLGVENANAEEAAALILLLDHTIADHGFKIGLGKALGMGSIRSRLKSVWIRHADDYHWKTIEFDCGTGQAASAMDTIGKDLPAIKIAIDDLLKVQAVEERLNSTKGMENRSLEYPSDLRSYWKWAAHNGLNE